MSSVLNPTESKRPASEREVVVTMEDERKRTFSSPKAPEGKHRDAGKQPIQEIEMIPASQMSRRPETSGAIQQHQQQLSQLQPPRSQLLQPPKPYPRPQPPLPGQVILTHPGRIQKQKIPPAVPVRKRKPTTTVADTTQNSFANTSALNSMANTPVQNSTVNTPPAQNSLTNFPAQNITTAQNPQDMQIKIPVIPKPDNAKAQTNGQNKPIAEPDNAKPQTSGQNKPIAEPDNAKIQTSSQNQPTPEPYNAKKEAQANGKTIPIPEPDNTKKEAQINGQNKPIPEPDNAKKEAQINGQNKPIPEPDNAKKEAQADMKNKPIPEPTVILKFLKETTPVPTEKTTPPNEKIDEQQKASKEASPTNPAPPEPKEKTIADATPQTIPPPPARPRRASSCGPNNESLLDPKDSLLIQRRSSSPQSYSGPVDNEFLKSYFPNRKDAPTDTPQGSQSQPNSLTASQKTLNSNTSQKSLNSNASKKSSNSNASQKSLNSNASQKSANLNASQKTSNKTSIDSLTNTKDDDKHTPIMVQSIIITPTSNGKLKRQSSLNDETNKKKNSQIKANDTDVTSALAIGGKVFKIRKQRLSHSATDLIEPAPAPHKKKGHKGKAGRSGRQDSIVSSDSVSVTSSPSYTTKTMEVPLLPNQTRKDIRDAINSAQQNVAKPTSLTKSVSTPAGLQTCVKFSGSNMTIHHKIIRDIRRSSTHISRVCNFRTLQFVFNLLILVGLGIGAFMYFKPPEPEIKYINKTITNTVALIPPDKNPAPGYCFKLIVNFCINHKVPYNYTIFPNHVVNMNQDQAEQELDMYDAIVDVRCYELAALFLCSVFVPKCGPQGELLYPCRSLCEETKRRCGFFLDVFGLPPLPDYLMECRLLPDSDNPNVCVGHREVKEAKLRAARPKCNAKGFQCDTTRCIPMDWKCDGHMDCEDKTDERNCNGKCANGSVHCGGDRCMNKSVICDGIIDCPYGQDERNCIRLHDKMGDVGRGLLQVYDPKLEDWIPACVSHWDNVNSANAICALMGYSHANYTRLIIKDTNVEVQAPTTVNISDYQQSSNWVKDFRNCGLHHYPIVNMECQNFECGRKRNPIAFHTKRIVGGSQSSPGSWPFLAAIHGGPEEIFYCAGVLIADEWVLTASHCVGNASEDNLDGWKIQLGMTRRYSHSYYGQKASVKRVIAHPQYNMGINHDNDIALFQLERPVTFTEHVLPVCLPPPELDLRPGMRCTVIGWGKSEDDECSEYEPALHEVEVPIINRRLCNEWMIYRELNVTDGMICAGLAEGGKDACQGDSGGPLLCPYDRYKKRWFVGGIVSWGIKCAHPQLPGVYAYVPKFVPWIREMMNRYSTE